MTHTPADVTRAIAAIHELQRREPTPTRPIGDDELNWHDLQEQRAESQADWRRNRPVSDREYGLREDRDERWRAGA